MRTPLRRDVTVAAVAAVALTGVQLGVYFLVNSRQPVPTWVPVSDLVIVSLLTTSGAATLAIRRLWPRLALTIATGLVLTSVALALASLGPVVGLFVGAYSVACCLPVRKSALALGLLAAAHAVGGVWLTATGGRIVGPSTFWGASGHNVVAVGFATLASFGLPAGLGWLVQRRRAYTEALTARAERLEAEREERDRAAAAEERRRIARELHDIAAHDLSAIVVQAGAADRLVGTDTAAARAILRDIRGQGRDTLTALRQLVGILREDDAGGRSPQPGVAQIGDLLAVARAAGTRVELTIVGEPRPLPAATDLAAFRVVQEALANARQHAPAAPVTVTLTYAADLRIVVTNGPAPSRTTLEGHGLIGMRERVRQVGGTLTAGPADGGGWTVDARLPVVRA